jgi:Fe2+ or Zn2+ uptake regulation protein
MQKSAGERLSGYFADQGLRSASQRNAILKTFVEAGQYLSAEELYARVKKTDPASAMQRYTAR